MSKTYRIVIALVLSMMLILAASSVAFAHGRSSHGDDHGNKPGQSQYHRQDGDHGHHGKSDDHRQDGDRHGGDDD